MSRTWLSCVAGTMLLLTQFAHAQPFEYSLQEVDDRGNCLIEEANVALGTRRTIAEDIGRATQLFVGANGSLLFIQIRGVLEVRSVDAPDTSIRILDDVEWVHEVLDIPLVARVYVTLGSDDISYSTLIFDRQNWRLLNTIREFWTYEPPILSADGATIYRSKSDSNHIKFATYNSATGQRTEDLLLASPSGFSSVPQVHDGRQGKALLSFELDPGGFDSQRYLVCNLDSGQSFPSFGVTFRSYGILSSEARYALIESVVWDSTRNPVEYRPGDITIFEGRTGLDRGSIELPPDGRIIVGSGTEPMAYYVIARDQPAIQILGPSSAQGPALEGLSPALTLTGSGAFTLTVTGSGFVNGARVLWNGASRPTTFVSPTKIRAAIAGSQIASPVTAQVTVRNPNGAVSSALTFSAVAVLPHPVKPVLECVTVNPNHSFTAWFGYRNENSVPVYIPIGAKNKFTPSPRNREQPTIFHPGRRAKVFSVVFPGSSLVWTLNGRTSTASRHSARCH